MASSSSLAASLLALLVAVVAAAPLQAQTTPEGKAKAAIGQALRAAFPMPLSDIRTQQLTGRRLVLKKGRIVMNNGRSVDNVYLNGKIHVEGSSSKPSGQDAVFEAGAKFFVVGLWTNSDGVGLMLMSPDQKLGGNLKFPFPHGTIPSVAYVFAQISEVVSVDSP